MGGNTSNFIIENNDLTNQNIIITGSSSGIGKHTALKLAKMNANIYFACRNEQKTNDTIKEIRESINNTSNILKYIHVDLMDLNSCREFVKHVKEKEKIKPIHVLINNAGMNSAHIDKSTKQNVELLFDDLIESNARIINVSSAMHLLMKAEDFKEVSLKGVVKNWGGAYRRSKGAQILFTKYLQKQFDKIKSDCTVMALCPGIVRTKIFDELSFFTKIFYPFYQKPETGCNNSVYLASCKELKDKKGKYFEYYYGKPQSSILDEELQEWLWKKSEELVEQEFSFEKYLVNYNKDD